MKFSILPIKRFLKKALEELGIEETRDIQARVIPHLLEESTDLVAQAPTGSGKSFAYIIPLLQRFDILSKSIQSIILVPTRELAQQVATQIEQVAKYEKVRVATVYGGAPLVAQMKAFTKIWPQIVVGTPGRMRELVVRKKMVLDRIETVIIDEADEMASHGFVEDINFILKSCGQKKIWMFSATFPPEVKDKIECYLNKPFRVKSKDFPKESSIQYINLEVAKESRYQAIESIIDDEKSETCLMFCQTRVEAVELHSFLLLKGFSALILHGGMEQSDRDKNLDLFQKKQSKILVCTDIAARGLNIDQLDVIFNVGLPEDGTAMIHRVGRLRQQGKVYNLIY